MPETKSEKLELFRIHTMLLNSERTTIWQRFNAFLVANTVALAFLEGHPLLLPIAGLVLSGGWLVIHLAGYKLFRDQLSTMSTKFQFDPMPGSPWYGQSDVPKPLIDWILCVSTALILGFMAAYIYLLIGALCVSQRV
ncbi:hypothetical protein [Pelagibius marinus]|uniref:hypothetical protein n=1 Tax=Pelagibius marinus TaxID=2762760 RepID=UPI001872FF8D|nr:hypothetical protein [Pelagibius marinus]